MERERCQGCLMAWCEMIPTLQPPGFLCHQANMLFRCSPVPLQPNLLASCVLLVDFLVSNPITVMILFYILHPSKARRGVYSRCM